MQSISQARERWSETNKPDQLLMDEHESLLGEAIKNAIDEGHHHVAYEIPWLLNGPWPIFNVDEVTIELIRRARLKGYHVRMTNRNPPILHISGWAANLKTRYYNANVVAHRHTTTAAAGKRGGGGGRKKSAAPEVTLNDVKRGVISSRLRQRLQKLQSNK